MGSELWVQRYVRRNMGSEPKLSDTANGAHTLLKCPGPMCDSINSAASSIFSCVTTTPER